KPSSQAASAGQPDPNATAAGSAADAATAEQPATENGQPTPQSAAAPNGDATSADPTAQAAEPGELASEDLGDENRQALEQWLRQIPDEPGELLRRKFWYEQ